MRVLLLLLVCLWAGFYQMVDLRRWDNCEQKRRGTCKDTSTSCQYGYIWPLLCGRTRKYGCCIGHGGGITTKECVYRGGRCIDILRYAGYNCVRGKWIDGYCGDNKDLLCCIKDYQLADVQCLLAGGECMHMDEYKCSHGKTWAGLCSGPASRKCCITNSTRSDKFCITKFGGHCVDVKEGCPVGYFLPKVKGCKHHPRRQCCIDSHVFSECLARGGKCIPKTEVRSRCTTWSNVYCGISSDYACCLNESLVNDIRCTRSGGRCIDSRSEQCVDGKTWQNLCGGESYRECCIRRSRPGDRKCIVTHSGQCRDTSTGCPFGQFLPDIRTCHEYPDWMCCKDTSHIFMHTNESKCLQDALSCSTFCNDVECESEFDTNHNLSLQDYLAKCRTLKEQIKCIHEKTAGCDSSWSYMVKINELFSNFHSACEKRLCYAGAQMCFDGYTVGFYRNGELSSDTIRRLCAADRQFDFNDCAAELTSLQQLYSCHVYRSSTWQYVLRMVKEKCAAEPTYEASSHCAFCAELSGHHLYVLQVQPQNTETVQWLSSRLRDGPTRWEPCTPRGVLKITPPSWAKSVTFLMTFEQPSNYAFHIADSPTNDGFGGNFGNSTFNAEIHHERKAPDLLIFESNVGSIERHLYKNVIKSAMMIRISKFSMYVTNYDDFSMYKYDPGLFVFDTMYFGINRVVYKTDMTEIYYGEGLCSVCIYFHKESTHELHGP